MADSTPRSEASVQAGEVSEGMAASGESVASALSETRTSESVASALSETRTSVSDGAETVVRRGPNVSVSEAPEDLLSSPQNESSNTDSSNASFQLYLRVLEGLAETRTGMNEIRACMNEAHTGMNETRVGMSEAREGMDVARAGIDDLRNVVRLQGDNINLILGAMASLTHRDSNSNVGNDSNSNVGNDVREVRHRSTTEPALGDTPVSRSAPPNSSQDSSQALIKVKRDVIPYFEARPSSDPLAKSQELETWLRRIELMAPWNADGARMQLARTYCKGTADLVINSPQFEDVENWSRFKHLLRQKFRGITNIGDFFNHLQRKVLKPGQTPQDFYLEIEGIVYLGAQDYPYGIGDSTSLIKRTFLAGLPRDLSDLLVACEDLPMHEIVAKATKLSATRSSSASNEPRRRLPVPVASTQGPAPVASAPVASAQGSTPVVSAQGSNYVTPYCHYHRMHGHNTAQCRSKPPGQVCWHCSSPGHLRPECPFLPGQTGSAQSQTGRTAVRAPDKDQAGE